MVLDAQESCFHSMGLAGAILAQLLLETARGGGIGATIPFIPAASFLFKASRSDNRPITSLRLVDWLWHRDPCCISYSGWWRRVAKQRRDAHKCEG